MFEKLTLPNGSVIANRIAKAAMEENMADADHAPSEQLMRLYQSWADGEAGLILSGNVMVDGAEGSPMISDFGVVDPDLSPAQEAFINNERPETQATAAAMRELLDDEPVYRHYDWLYLTEG